MPARRSYGPRPGSLEPRARNDSDAAADHALGGAPVGRIQRRSLSTAISAAGSYCGDEAYWLALPAVTASARELSPAAKLLYSAILAAGPDAPPRLLANCIGLPVERLGPLYRELRDGGYLDHILAHAAPDE